jgi:fluoroacetyl-CoA thioesterase
VKETLICGIESRFCFRITEAKTVPALYPESPEFQEMPKVFATGFLVGLLEWACIKAVRPHLDWPAEQTVGTHINISHCAATPVGLEVTASVKLVHVDGRRLVFDVEAHDGVDLVGKGGHERVVIYKDRFAAKVQLKAHAPLPKTQ